MKSREFIGGILLLLVVCIVAVRVVSRSFVLVISEDELREGEKNKGEEEFDDTSPSFSSPDPSLSSWRSVFDHHQLYPQTNTPAQQFIPENNIVGFGDKNLHGKEVYKKSPDETTAAYSDLNNMVEFGEDEENSNEKTGALKKIVRYGEGEENLNEKNQEEKKSDMDRTSEKTIEEKEEEKTRVYKGLRNMVEYGDLNLMMEGAEEMQREGEKGNPHAMSVVGFMYNFGILRENDKAKAFLFHYFAAQGGNMESKLFVAYTYLRQHMYEKAVKLYAELAEVAVNSFLTSKDQPVLETVRIHSGTEENKEALRKSRGEEDEGFQILEYQAQKGNAVAMYKIGLFYYFGLRGLRRDYVKALTWFLKAVERGEPRSMEILGEMYAKGAGVERNYTRSLGWLKLASRQHLYSAYNGIGYLYMKGYGVEEKNFTKAKEYFEKAADNDEAGGNYNLGVMYLKGIGVKRDVQLACKYFILAANAGQPKAFFQLAKMFHTGVGLKKNIPMATALYKLVAERGPWSSLSRWALESYLKGDVGKAFFLYSRMSELGYEIAQSNAAWILDKYGDRSMCIGESGFCTGSERYQRAHILWWQASEQGNEHAALLIGDAYYYGLGTERDYDRAAKAYMHAKSQSNAQAMFNLGYMHEHGQGLPLDLHLAKRYYDQALEFDRAAKLPVTVALACLWIRRNYASSFLVDWIDSLPELYPKVDAWVQDVIKEEGNVTIFTLFVCLLTVLYLRERQRRHAIAGVAQPPQPHNQIPHM